MTETEFTKGLVAGVPPDIKIAHKFGAFGTIQNGKIVGTELHDCGIVYINNPYLLCVMTKGYSTDQLADVIRQVSQLVYKSVK